MKETRTTRRRVAPAPSSAARPICRHHWVIDAPNGPTANGVCKLCGGRRRFRTSTDDYIREDKSASAAA